MMRYVMTLVLLGTVLTLLAGCSPAASVAPPEVMDTWQPPEGVEAAPPVSCAEIRSLFAFDAQTPLDIQEEKRQQDAGVTVIEFNYASPMGGRVPAILIVPDGAGPFAGLVFMHGSGGTRWDLRDIAIGYARLGAVGITISAPSARPQHADFNPFTFREKDRREQIQLIVDLRRAVDVLLTHPEIDPQRLAYMGNSYGGAMGGLLAGVEDRLKGYALMVGDGGLVTHFSGAFVMGLPEKVRREWLAAMWPIEPIHYVGCAAPAALLFQNGTLDKLVRPADALRYQQAGSEPKTILWYEAGHSLDQKASKDQAEWLSGIIGIASYRWAFPVSLRIPLTIWFLLTAGSLVLLTLDTWRRRPAPGGARLLWLLATILLGPLGLATYWVSGRQPDDTGDSPRTISPARRALGSAEWAAAGNMCGFIVVLWLVLTFPQAIGNNQNGYVQLIAAAFLASFCSGWILFVIARWISRSDERFLSCYRRPLFAEIASTCLVLAGVFSAVLLLLNRDVGRWTGFFGLDLSYPPLWGVLSLAVLAGALLTYPLHLWLIRRGTIRWGEPAISEEPTVKKLAWYKQAVLLLSTFALMLTVMVTAILLSM